MPEPNWLTQVDKLYHMTAFAALVIPAALFDFLADAAGLVLGLGVGWLLRRTFSQQEPR